MDLGSIAGAAARREGLVAYLELHIEQGPVLDREGVPVAAVSGTAGVERHRFTFRGQAAHAGTTPMDDAPRRRLWPRRRRRWRWRASPARTAAWAPPASLRLAPGIPTAVAGDAELVGGPAPPRGGPARARCSPRPAPPRAARPRNADASCEESEIWRIEPIAFDPRLVAAAREESGNERALASGALHDAAEMARRLPVAMIFAPSIGGISHAQEEDTREEDLERAIAAFGRLALRTARGEIL